MNTDQIECIKKKVRELEKMRVDLATIRDSLPVGNDRAFITNAIRHNSIAGDNLTAAVPK